MMLMTRLIELLFVNRRLKTSRPYVFSALTGFAMLALLGVFGTFLCALIAAGLLWLLFVQTLAMGAGLAAAVLITLVAALCALMLAALAASRLWSGVRSDINRLIEGQLPVGAPLVDKTVGTIGNVAGAFMNGFRHRRKSGG